MIKPFFVFVSNVCEPIRNTMKNRKKVFFILVAMMLMATGMKAQQRGGNRARLSPEDRAKRSVETLDKELTLTQTQKDSIYQFSLNEATEQQKLFQANGDANGRRSNFEKMRNLRTDTQKKIKRILTEEQQKVYDVFIKEQQSRMSGRREGRGA